MRTHELNMQGHSNIIKARLMGLAPANGVTLTDDARYWRRIMADAERLSMARLPHVLVERYDTPRGCDLRFVYGIPVRIEMESPQRCEQWVDACIAAGASLIVGWGRSNVYYLRLFNRLKRLDERDAA